MEQNGKEKPTTYDPETLAANYPDTVILDGFDDAIIGIDTDDRLVYSYDVMVETLMERDGMSDEEAADFISYNTIRALPYMGSYKPIIIYGAEYIN